LARWAGVGVFVLALLVACGYGPTEPTPTPSGEGFVWAYTESIQNERWLLKIDVGTGDIFDFGVVGFAKGDRPVGIPADAETGEFFLHRDSRFIAKYDAHGENVWKTETSYDLFHSLGYYKKGGILWAYGGGELEKYRSDNGEYISVIRFSPLMATDIPIQVDEKNGSVWVADEERLLKFSFGGEKMFEAFYEGEEHDIKNMAIDQNTGDLWIAVHDTKPYGRDRLIKYGPNGTKLAEKEVFAHKGGPGGMGVDPLTGEIWLSYEDDIVVQRPTGDFMKIIPGYKYVRSFTFVNEKAILAGGEYAGFFNIQAINKDTGKEYWDKYSWTTPGIVRTCYTEK
jgi:hypothetical protein